MREQRWWLAACGGGFAIAWLVGGFLGPAVTLFVIVYLLGSLLIAFEDGRADVSAHDREAEAAADPDDAEVGDAEVGDAEVADCAELDDGELDDAEV